MSTGRREIAVNENSTNNDKLITSKETNTKLCSFKDTTTTKTNATCTMTLNNDQLVSVDCGTFRYNTAKSDLAGVDFSKSCTSIQLYMYCDRNQGYCTLNKDAMFGETTEGDNTETGDVINTPDYSCSYIGKIISDKTLKISKFTDKWVIEYPDGTTRNIPTNNVDSNVLPTSKCEDIFYSIADNVIKMVDADSNYANIYVSQYCSQYDDLEQFCEHGDCKIKDAACGNKLDNASEYGECPSELKPIILFLKKVVFNTIQIFVPILLILMGAIDFVKAVMASDDKVGKDSVSKFIKRVLSAITIFFLTTIVVVVMNMFAETDVGQQNDWKSCWINID